MSKVSIDRIPTPVARMFVRHRNSKSSRDRHDLAVHVLEVVVKLVAAALASRYRALGERSPAVDRALRNLARPSLGQWVEILRSTAKFLGESKADEWSVALDSRLRAKYDLGELFGEIAETVRMKGKRPARPTGIQLIDLIPKYRNQFGHGAIPSADVYARLEELPLELARALVAEVDVLGGARLLVAQESDGDAEDSRVVWKNLSGPQPTAAPIVEEGQDSIRRGGLYLEVEGGRVSLHPLVHRAQGELGDEIFFANGADDAKRLRSVSYLCYDTGNVIDSSGRDDDSGLHTSFCEMLSWVVETQVDSAKLKDLAERSMAEAGADGEVVSMKTADGEEVRVPGFQDAELIGQSMAVVYKARQASLGRTVALKVLPPAYGTNTEMAKRFQREIKALSRCDHPNVVKILTAGRASGTFYFAMEYIDGADLSALVAELGEIRSEGVEAMLDSHFEIAATRARSAESQRETIDFSEIRRGRNVAFRIAELIRDIASAVQHLHERGITHRDLKPGNIRLTLDLQPVVMDLGLAKLDDSGFSQTADRSVLIGTLPYMAPEQFQALKQEVGSPADIYALGAILFELVCGRRMNDGKNEDEIRRQVTLGAPPAPAKVEPSIPTDLANIIMTATRRDPLDRHPSAAALAEDLDLFLRGLRPKHATPWTAGRAMKDYVRRWGKRIALISAAASAVIAVSLFALHFAKERRFDEQLGAAERALRSEAVEDARRAVAGLQNEFPNRDETRTAATRLDELIVELQARKARGLMAQGLGAFREFEEKREEEMKLRATIPYPGVVDENIKLPPWERREEFATRTRVRLLSTERDAAFNRSQGLLKQALELAPDGSLTEKEARTALSRVFLSRFHEGPVMLQPEYFAELVRELSLNDEPEELSGLRRITLSSSPAGAHVYLYRYEEIEGRLVPSPFHPNSNETRKPILRVESVLAELPFKPGDELVSVASVPVRTRGGLADALRAADSDTVAVVVLRKGERRELTWSPGWPREESQPLRLPALDLRLTFEGYPLRYDYPPAFPREALLGTTKEPLDVELRRGSYLLVFELAGRLTTRVPLSVPESLPRGVDSISVKLEKDYPQVPNFEWVLISEGAAHIGGDKSAYFAVEKKNVPEDSFFMARREVTFGRYLDFLESIEVARTALAKGREIRVKGLEAYETIMASERTEAQKRAAVKSLQNQMKDFQERAFKPAQEWNPGSTDELLGGVPRATAIDLVPPQIRLGNVDRGRGDDKAVSGVTFDAALEFVEWFNREYGSGQWEFSLATDEQWEKAARGADRRAHVWGDTLVWSYCNSLHSPSGGLSHGSHYPFDESVYGVLGMAGSVSEYTTSLLFTSTGQRRVDRYFSLRGGDWTRSDFRDFRCATRNRARTDGSNNHRGIRLVAKRIPQRT